MVVDIVGHLIEKASPFLQEQILEHLLPILSYECLNDLFKVSTKHGQHILRLSLEETFKEEVKE
jgi:hypothetical protein